uniref:non-specific serine/threonine protein kinase n=1 Tax=Sphenodon punctatus TaxID=8508 RepID=A0A8D0HVX0_SPHPU
MDDMGEEGIRNPFTSQLPPELQALKEQQANSLAPRSGQSKILRKARQKMAQEARTILPCPTGPSGSTASLPRPPGEELGLSRGWGGGASGKMEPEHRHSIETVDLETEELDSDEEWQQLVEATEPSRMHLSAPLSLLGDPAFLQRIHTRLGDAGQEVLEGMLEGAAHLRPALRVIGNLLATRCDSELLSAFCRELGLPRRLLGMAGQILGKVTAQPLWRPHLAPPLGAGFYDGLLLLVLQLLSQGDAATVREFAGSELWRAAWHRVAMVLQPVRGMPAMEGETARASQPAPEPDWATLSPQGTVLFLSLALFVFTREPHQCLHQLAQPHGVVMATLTKLLSLDFLDRLAQTHQGGDPALVPSTVLQACQLLCFPFALDMDAETLALVRAGVMEAELPAQLLQVCSRHLPLLETELPLSLLSHWALRDQRAIEQVVGAAASEPSRAFLSAILLSDSPALLADLLSLLTHVARAGPTYLPFLQEVLGCWDSGYQPLRHLLCHPECPVRARACSLVGNLLRHSQELPPVPQGQAGLLELMLERLADEDGQVRRSASFAIGNAAYQAGSLAQTLSKAVPGVVRLLSDPQPKTRCNAASALGNLGRQSVELGDLLIQSKAPQLLLDAACHDPQLPVQEAALVALRTISQQPRIHQVLVKLRASEKLGALSFSECRGSSARSPRPASARHCEKLILLLQPAAQST